MLLCLFFNNSIIKNYNFLIITIVTNKFLIFLILFIKIQ